MDPYTALAAGIIALLQSYAQMELLIATNLPAEQRAKWAADQLLIRQPFLDLMKAITHKVGTP